MDFEKLTELIIELEVDDIADAVKEALKEDKDPFPDLIDEEEMDATLTEKFSFETVPK